MAVYLLAIRRTRRRDRTLFILFRLLLVSILLALIIYLTARRIRAHSPRQIPTLFPPAPGDDLNPPTVQHLIPLPQEKPFRTIDKHTLDIDGGRYLYIKTLGRGYEGEGRVYLDTQQPGGGGKVVIKTFFGGTRVNPLPGHLFGVFNPGVESWYRLIVRPINWMLAGSGLWGAAVSSWPVEIPATLWFGRGGSGESGLVRALDYFYVKNRLFGKQWQLVMPYYEDGTVDDLAFLVRRLGLKPDEVDSVYRRDFLRFLESLGRMHEDGYCHGDIKTDNIFLSPAAPQPLSPLSNLTAMTMSWLVSDLGNVRERPHIWHFARPDLARPPLVLDSRADCRVVDTTRALKTYISFLTQATGDSLREEEFDREFYGGRRGWSWIYWRFILSPGVGSWDETLTPVEILREIFIREKERRWEELEDNGEGVERERLVGEKYVMAIREEVAVLGGEWKSWRAGTLGGKPLWMENEMVLGNGWKEGLEIPQEVVYKERKSWAKVTKYQYGQKIITAEVDHGTLREAIDLELDCTANEKQRGLPQRVWGMATE